VTVSSALISEASPSIVTERPVSAVMVPVSQTASATVTLQTPAVAVRSSPTGAQAPQPPQAPAESGAGEAPASATPSPVPVPVPGGSAPAPAAPATPGEPGASPDSDAAPSEAPRSERGGDAVASGESEIEAPQLVTGLRARLGSVYQGLTARLAKLFDGRTDVVVLEDRRAADPASVDPKGSEAADPAGAHVSPVADGSDADRRESPSAGPTG